MPSIFYLSYFAVWVLVVTQGVLLLLVYRHFGLQSLGTAEGVQRDGLSIGETAPAFRGRNLFNESTEWTPQLGHLYLLVFISPTCAPCRKIIPVLLRLATMSREVEIVFMVDGPPRLLEKLISEFHPPSLVVCFTADEESNAYPLYRVRAIPFAFIIGPDSHIRDKGICDSAGLERLLKAGGLEIPEGLLELEGVM